MLRLVLPAALLVACLAVPATAQQNSTHNAGCEVHRVDQMRCALRIPMVGNYQQQMLLVTRGDGRISGSTQGWISECGLPGTAGPVVTLRNNGATTAIRRSTMTAASVTCPEIFIFNCQEDGRAVPCSRGFANASIRVELRQ